MHIHYYMKLFLFLQTGEKYVLMLHHSITTWPSNRRISIVAIETMSRALNATLAIVDYSNVTAAVSDLQAIIPSLIET